MATKRTSGKYIKFIIYLVVVVLLNIVGYSLFFRVDLTENKIFSLSDISKEVVSTLTEPMTINVFFSDGLPAPHNNTKRYLQDLLKEYEINGNDFFNYRFYDISSAGEETAESKNNKDLAESYGINPVQIRMIEQDEIKFKNVYMGLVLIHGDLIEKIPALTDVDMLEYTLTMRMQKLNNKISALLGLKEKILVELYMSSSLNTVAPYMKLNELSKVPSEIESTVQKINQKNYGRLVYKYIDPSQENNLEEMVKKHNIMALKWNDIGDKVKAGEGGIGLVLRYKDKTVDIPLMHVMRIPIFGDQYELVNMDDLEDLINGGIESLIDINQKVGYLADHGTLDRFGAAAMMGGQGQSDLNNFNGLMGQNYSLENVDLATKGIPGDIESLIIANPTENFTDYELYQIDQALMSGKNLALFLDAFKEVQQPRQQFSFNQGPGFQPLNTGLEKLLKHYGLTVSKAYVMDENCFKQPMGQRFGGGERALYFAPMIQNQNINKDLDFMKNIKGLITMRAAPVSVNDSLLKENGINAYPLFSSSDKSWEMKGNINLNPMFIQPPKDDSDKKSYPVAYLLDGTFPSYFDGKPIPEKTVAEKETEEGKNAQKKDQKPDLSSFENEGGFIAKSKPAKILLVASAEMLKDNMLDQEGRSPNATFIMNAIDAVNGRRDVAQMRSKKQSFNPLDETDTMVKAGIKWFNIAGLPVLVVFFGLLVWIKRKAHKKRIQMMFQK
jgi:ABC-2 type transport system permease protein